MISLPKPGAPGGLRDDHPEDGLQLGEPEGIGRLDLPLPDGEQRAADVFRLVRARAEDEAEHGGGIGLEVNAEVGQAEIENHELHGERHAPDDGYCGVGQAAGPTGAEDARHAG